ncbi:hypothetical protein KQX54_015610 [Cotesia glomerata]|uniref:Uncharacterized protein n=1 Tax=Cotesia glomerata TaxID=32391 RepID=A0AAV7I9R2_COTGL|nr:hypothetical protein KQX54_015610 [Cotesia glomerata]
MSPLNDKITPVQHHEENYVELLDDIEYETLVLQELEKFDPTNEEYNKMKLREFKGILRKVYSECVDGYVSLMAIQRIKLDPREWRMIMKNLHPMPKMPSFFITPPVTPKKKDYRNEFKKIHSKLIELKAFIYREAAQAHRRCLELKDKVQNNCDNNTLIRPNPRFPGFSVSPTDGGTGQTPISQGGCLQSGSTPAQSTAESQFGGTPLQIGAPDHTPYCSLADLRRCTVTGGVTGAVRGTPRRPVCASKTPPDRTGMDARRADAARQYPAQTKHQEGNFHGLQYRTASFQGDAVPEPYGTPD